MSRTPLIAVAVVLVAGGAVAAWQLGGSKQQDRGGAEVSGGTEGGGAVTTGGPRSGEPSYRGSVPLDRKDDPMVQPAEGVVARGPSPARDPGTAAAGDRVAVEHPRADSTGGTLEPVRIDSDGTRTYVMDNGAVVQDHRGEGYGPPVAPPALPPGKRTMSPEITARIFQLLRPGVTKCAAKVPAAERGPDPFVYVTMTVAVAAGRLTTTDVYPTTHDLKGDSVDGYVNCVREAGMAVTLDRTGEPDRTDYVVQYPIRVR